MTDHDFRTDWIARRYESDYTTAAVLACPECGATPAIKPYGVYDPKVYVVCPACNVEGWIDQSEIHP